MTSRVDSGIFFKNTKRYKTRILTSLTNSTSIRIDRMRSNTSTLTNRMGLRKTTLLEAKKHTTRSIPQTKSITKYTVNKVTCKIISILSECRVMATATHAPKLQVKYHYGKTLFLKLTGH